MTTANSNSSNSERNGETIDENHTRYAALVVEAGGVLIYDTENHRAWIQSDQATVLTNVV